jgi:hypothetical protein
MKFVFLSRAFLPHILKGKLIFFSWVVTHKILYLSAETGEVLSAQYDESKCTASIRNCWFTDSQTFIIPQALQWFISKCNIALQHFSTATVHEWNDEIDLPTMVALWGVASNHITDNTKESYRSTLREMCQQNKKKL